MIKAILTVIGIIVLANILFAIASFTGDSLIIKIKPLKRVYIFAHGHYRFFEDGTYAHITKLKGAKGIPTIELLQQLRKEGYQKIWVSMCQQGDSEYVATFSNGMNVFWGSDVSRVYKSGTVYPVFIGIGIYRVVL